MITYEEYHKFLRSKKWKKFSKKLLSQVKGCSICDKSSQLLVHHLSGSESSWEDLFNLKNLKVVCRTCHGFLTWRIHKKNFLMAKKRILKIYKSKAWKTYLKEKAKEKAYLKALKRKRKHIH